MFDVFINNSSRIRSIVENSYWRCTAIYGGKGGGNIREYKIQMCHRFLRFHLLWLQFLGRKYNTRSIYLRNGKILIRCTKMQLYMINQTFNHNKFGFSKKFYSCIKKCNAELLHNSILPQFNL